MYDMRMLEATCRPRLAQKARPHLFAVDPQQLEGDESVDGRVEGEEERAHAALPEPLPDLIAADD